MLAFETFNTNTVALGAVALLLTLVLYILARSSFKAAPYRIVIISLLILSALGPVWRTTEELYVAHSLLDISDSLDRNSGERLLSGIQKLNTNDSEIKLFTFAKQRSAFSRSSSDIGSFSDLRTQDAYLNIGATNLAQVLTSFSQEHGPTNVLLASDGQQTEGDISNVLDIVREKNVRIFPIIPEEFLSSGDSLRITQLSAPLVAPSNESVDIKTTLSNQTSEPQRGILRVKHDGKTLYQERVTIPAESERVIEVESDPTAEGLKEVSAVFVPENREYRGSSGIAYIANEARERVILISGADEDARFLKKVFKDQSYKVEDLISPGASSKLPELTEVSTVILNNVSYKHLPNELNRKVESFVKRGGGLLLIGGNRSFGLGGYRKTIYEELSPVEFLPPQTKKKRLNAAVALVLDKSRSMSFGQKMDYAKEAARETVKNLKNDDYIGVIGFDSSPFVVVKMDRLSRIRQSAIERIGRLFPAGKTNLLPAIDEARRSLIRAQAGRKHVIILTDGRIPDEGPYYLEIVRQLRVLGITVSTVMLGGETRTRMLREMARLGGGSFYQTTDARSLPKIFLKDIRVSTGEKTMKESQQFLVRTGPEHGMSTKLRSYPELRGYVQTKMKPKGELELVTLADKKAEPLLASWKVGDGRSTVFTSDANGRWSGEWISWSQFYRFWRDLMDSLRDREDPNSYRFDLRHEVRGNSLQLSVALYGKEDAGSLTAAVTYPDNTIRNITFIREVKGKYHAQVPDALAGKYEVRLKADESKLTPVAFHLSGELFGEKQGEGFDLPLLSELASKTGGKINPSSEELRAQPIVTTRDFPLAPWLFSLALLLFFAEIYRREIGAFPLRRMTMRP